MSAGFELPQAARTHGGSELDSAGPAIPVWVLATSYLMDETGFEIA
jgi:hypothetical protein